MKNIALTSLLVLVAGTAAAQVVPPDQAAFQAAITAARDAYDSAANDLAKGGERPKRAAAICAAVPSRKVDGWIGTIYNLSSNSDGWGVVSIELEGDIWISTWNNAVSDVGDQTLIDPTSALFAAVAGLSEGQKVMFSGTFFEDNGEGDCFKEMSMSQAGSMSQPEFVFDFSSVSSAD